MEMGFFYVETLINFKCCWEMLERLFQNHVDL
jgi:hypothetical protein